MSDPIPPLPLPRHSLDTPAPWYARYSKALAALLGTLTPGAVLALLGLFGVHVDSTVAMAIVTVLGFLSTILAPANAAKE